MASLNKLQNLKMHCYDQYNHDKRQKTNIYCVISNECLHLQVKKYQIKP
jgi:hypothetical protein